MSGTGRSAVFLDRDGVLNHPVVRDGKPYPPASASEFTLVDDAPEACLTLRQRGLMLIVVTNQPDVARGLQQLDEVEAIHNKLRSLVDVDAIYVCPHDDADGCTCRKPAPGMLRGAAREHGLDLHTSYLIGDRWRDIEAGRQAGCRTVLIDRGYDERPADAPNKIATSLAEASEWVQADLIRRERSIHA